MLGWAFTGPSSDSQGDIHRWALGVFQERFKWAHAGHSQIHTRIQASHVLNASLA